jgi:hypothetical protein
MQRDAYDKRGVKVPVTGDPIEEESGKSMVVAW